MMIVNQQACMSTVRFTALINVDKHQTEETVDRRDTQAPVYVEAHRYALAASHYVFTVVERAHQQLDEPLSQVYGPQPVPLGALDDDLQFASPAFEQVWRESIFECVSVTTEGYDHFYEYKLIFHGQRLAVGLLRQFSWSDGYHLELHRAAIGRYRDLVTTLHEPITGQSVEQIGAAQDRVAVVEVRLISIYTAGVPTGQYF